MTRVVPLSVDSAVLQLLGGSKGTDIVVTEVGLYG